MNELLKWMKMKSFSSEYQLIRFCRLIHNKHRFYLQQQQQQQQ